MNEAQPTVIAQHTRLKGEFQFAGPAVVAGRVDGSVMSEDALEVSPEGVIEGDIQGILVDIQGTVKGNIVATRSCRLGPTSRVHGEIRAANLSFAEGAFFAGQVFVGTESGEVPVDGTEGIQAAQAVAGSINRLQSLAAQADETAEMASSVSAGPVGAMRNEPAGPTVRVMSQNVQQMNQNVQPMNQNVQPMNRARRIIKAR